MLNQRNLTNYFLINLQINQFSCLVLALLNDSFMIKNFTECDIFFFQFCLDLRRVNGIIFPKHGWAVNWGKCVAIFGYFLAFSSILTSFSSFNCWLKKNRSDKFLKWKLFPKTLQKRHFNKLSRIIKSKMITVFWICLDLFYSQRATLLKID